ncbi:MAG: hypothetical protein AAFY71_20275 [Bacteroidota bacterium]
MDKVLPNLQNYVSLGYLFLLALGILHDVIYYSFLGINIMSYVAVPDILLSPIAYMMENWRMAVMVVVVSVGAYYFTQFVGKQQEKSLKKMEREGRLTEKIKKQNEKLASNITPFSFILLMILSMYLGAGIGGGSKRASQIEEGELKMRDLITFRNGRQQVARIVGQTSGFLFYVKDGGQEVTISPIQGNVKQIEDYKAPELEGESTNQK